MDFSAIRSRLAGSEGRLYWRSLGELADTPRVPRVPAPRVPRAGLRVERPEGPPPVPEADERVAGAGGRRRLHQAAAGSRSFPTSGSPRTSSRAVRCSSRARSRSPVAQPVLVESHMGRPTKIEGNPDHPASLGATDAFTQAAILGLYDPDRAQTVTFAGEVRAWSTFLTAMQAALAAQKATPGRRPPVPDRADHVAVAGGADGDGASAIIPQARWHQCDPDRRGSARGRAPADAEPDLSLRQGRRRRRRSTPTSCAAARARPLHARLRRPTPASPTTARR